MPDYIWCKNEERRIPAFRCLLCRDNCYSVTREEGETESALEMLIKSGKYKERFVMKRKESPVSEDKPASDVKTDKKSDNRTEGKAQSKERILVMEDGKLQPFLSEDYTMSTLYQVIEAFSVESRLVKPEDPGNIVFEGKKPSKKTVPVIVTRTGENLYADSWESLESKPEQLADATEVIGVTPVKQVFVLKRK